MPFSAPLVQLAAAASLAIAAPTVVETGPELPVQTPGFDSNHMVCKKFPPPVGTRIGPRKICKTALEWQMIHDSEYEAVDRALRKPCDVGKGLELCG